MSRRRSPITDAKGMHGAITVTDRIRARYGQGRVGQTYATIAKEYGVSRQLVHAALTRPASLPRRRRRAMQPFVARFPAEQLERCRGEARGDGKSLGAWLRAVVVRYLDGGTASPSSLFPS